MSDGGGIFQFPTPAGPAGVAGATGPNGVNSGTSFRDGAGVPSNALGADGDYYLNDTNGDLYLKSAGTYSVVASLAGPPGSTGATGSTGAAGPSGLPYQSGAYYAQPGIPNGLHGLTASVLYAVPYQVRYSQSFTKIAVASAGTGTVRLGIYHEGGGVPGTLLVDGGSTGAVGGLVEVSITQTLAAGWYWLAAACQGGSGQLVTVGSGDLAQLPNIPYTEDQTMGYSQTGVAGALPDPFGAITHEYQPPHIFLKTA